MNDESGIDECLHREYGYAPRGEKVIKSISEKKFQRTNIVAAKLVIDPCTRAIQWNDRCIRCFKRIIFLPPYSPELNPIENFRHTLKHWLRMNIRDYDSLTDAISAAFHIYQTRPRLIFKWDYYNKKGRYLP